MFQSNAMITNSFSTSIYHKKTFTGLYPKWDSLTPRKNKINLKRSLTYHCLCICSPTSLLQSPLNDLKNLLLCNGYPRVLLLTTWTKFWPETEPNLKILSLRYPREMSLLFCLIWDFWSKFSTKQLKSFINTFYGCINLKIIFCNTHHIKFIPLQGQD